MTWNTPRTGLPETPQPEPSPFYHWIVALAAVTVGSIVGKALQSLQ
jgi:hypothetical protein